jgi:DnaJ-class molecular chaperone
MDLDYYDVLGLKKGCSEDDIKKAYRALSFKYHPDRNKEADAGDKIRKINDAYETLGDKQKRAHYDMEQSGGSPFDNILNELFRHQGGGGRGGGIHQIFKQNMMFHGANQPAFEVMFSNEMPPFFNAPKAQPPPTLEKNINITFEQSYTGTNIPFVIERDIKEGQLTYQEQEKVYIPIPQGIDGGEILQIPEKGHIYNGIKGDIKLHVHITPHEKFDRRGLNIVYKQTLTFKESICGFESILSHLDGNQMRLLSSRGNIIQNGDERVLKGKGFARNNQNGDLIIAFKVISPADLTEDQLKLCESIF